MALVWVCILDRINTVYCVVCLELFIVKVDGVAGWFVFSIHVSVCLYRTCLALCISNCLFFSVFLECMADVKNICVPSYVCFGCVCLLQVLTVCPCLACLSILELPQICVAGMIRASLWSLVSPAPHLTPASSIVPSTQPIWRVRTSHHVHHLSNSLYLVSVMLRGRWHNLYSSSSSSFSFFSFSLFARITPVGILFKWLTI